jgi:hypothetical protein
MLVCVFSRLACPCFNCTKHTVCILFHLMHLHTTAEVIAKRTASPTSTATSGAPFNDVSSSSNCGSSSAVIHHGSTKLDDNVETTIIATTAKTSTTDTIPAAKESTTTSSYNSSSFPTNSLKDFTTASLNILDAPVSTNSNDTKVQQSSTSCYMKKIVVGTPKPQRPMKKRKIVIAESNTPQSDSKLEEGTSNMASTEKPLSPTLSSFSSSSSSSLTTIITSPQTPKLIGGASHLLDNDQLLSSRALFYSQTIEEEPALYREILLHMALERETPRKPGGGAPDHHHHQNGHRRSKTSDSTFSSVIGGSSASISESSSSDEDGSASSSSSGGHPPISIGKRRGNQYVEGVSIHTMMVGSSGGSGPLSKVITNGFFWKDVPELESILQKYMEEYYEMRYVSDSERRVTFVVYVCVRLAMSYCYIFVSRSNDPLQSFFWQTHSENCPQSKNQQQFNNRLVGIIYSTALECGYTFDPESFNCSEVGEAGSITASDPSPFPAETIGYPDCVVRNNTTTTTTTTTSSSSFNYKKLRDRIRCYYKTHVQNSKKRLKTLLKNPSRPKNREILIKIVEEVKDRANNVSCGGGGDVGVGRRQLSLNGKAALCRLEEKEQSMLLLCTTNSCLVTPSQRREDGNGTIAELPSSICRSVASNSSSSGVFGCVSSRQESPPQWDAPPLTRTTVPVDAGNYDLSDANAEAPQFASPCKPEHVAMLTSIRRQVPSQCLLNASSPTTSFCRGVYHLPSSCSM